MKEKPIIFSPQMVRAILEGRKTQTRRVVKKPEYFPCLTGDCPHWDKALCATEMQRHSPYGQPGHQLWVRERIALRPERTQKMLREGADTWPKCVYIADGAWYGAKRNLASMSNTNYDSEGNYDSEVEAGLWKDTGFKSVPSIFMPRWASRITLEVASIRVEHLYDISIDDCKAEGIECDLHEGGFNCGGQYTMPFRPKYFGLWDQINGKRAPWSSNPWVWCISFRRIHAG